jgi:hypothetical protein
MKKHKRRQLLQDEMRGFATMETPAPADLSVSEQATSESSSGPEVPGDTAEELLNAMKLCQKSWESLAKLDSVSRDYQVVGFSLAMIESDSDYDEEPREVFETAAIAIPVERHDAFASETVKDLARSLLLRNLLRGLQSVHELSEIVRQQLAEELGEEEVASAEN